MQETSQAHFIKFGLVVLEELLSKDRHTSSFTSSDDRHNTITKTHLENLSVQVRLMYSTRNTTTSDKGQVPRISSHFIQIQVRHTEQQFSRQQQTGGK